MKTALVMGGNRFIGKRLVEELLQKGVRVTLANRMRNVDPFGDRVERVCIDRTDRESLFALTRGREWDVVFDQVCYAPEDAANAVEAFAGKTGKYVLTSTCSVYPIDGREHPESHFDPYTYPIPAGKQANLPYDEGKKLAEAVFFQRATFPVVAVRLPIVMGEDDYTERLLFHIRHVLQQEPMGIPNLQARLSFISAEEAGRFLVWAGEANVEGPLNACADGTISLQELIAIIEQETGLPATVVPARDSHMSPYGALHSWTFNTDRAKEAGYAFSSLQEWLPTLIRKLVQREQQNSASLA